MWFGSVFAGIVLAVAAALYDQRPYRRWKIRWGYFALAVVCAVVASMTIIIGHITTSQHSVTLNGTPARIVGMLLLATAGLAFAGSFGRRTSPDDH